MEQQYVGPLLAVLTLGIGGGALLAGIVSRGKVELGLVPLGGLGIAVTSMLMAAVPGGAAGHPAIAGYYSSCVLLLAMGVTAGLYDIPLQAFLQDRSPPESRGSIMAAYNFLAFAGMLAASGVYWLLSGPLGLSARTIFLVGGIITVPVTISIVRLLPFQTTRLAVRLLTDCMYRVRVEGLENVPARRRRWWWPTTSVGPTASCWAWPARDIPRMVAYAKYFENPLAGLVWPAGPDHPHRHDPEVDGRIDPRRPRGLATGRIGVHLSRRRDQPQRRNAGVPARASCRY